MNHTLLPTFQSSYPTKEEVEEMNMVQLGWWVRHAASPGASAYGQREFEEVAAKERSILERIYQRFQQGGGWTPALSKAVGWGGEA